MRVLAPRAFSCHVKVFAYEPDGRQAWQGRDGKTREYDLRKSLTILKEAGYRGPLCVESGASGNGRDNIRDAVSYLRDLAARV